MKRPNRCKRTRQALREAQRELKWAEQAYSRNPGRDKAHEIQYAKRAVWRAYDAHSECRAPARKARKG